MNEKKTARRSVPIAVIAIAAALIITAVAFFIPKADGSFNLRSMNTFFQIRSFLRDVVAGNFERASEEIYFFDSSPHEGTSLSENEARKIWTKRMTDLRDDSFSEHMVNFENLDVYLKDGEPVATFSVLLSVRGVERRYSTRILFYNGKIASISTESVLSDYEKAISGRLIY